MAVGWLLFAGTPTRAEERAALAGPLQDYIARPDPDFGWTERSAGHLGTTTYVELAFISQEWRGITWRHQLYLVKPSTLRPDATHALLVIAGGRWKEEFERAPTHISLPKSAPVYAELAEMLGTPVAVLLQVPFQPLFDDLSEDWLIAYTFERFLQTGDTDWPLLLPMVKSGVRAMDAVQRYAAHKWGLNLKTFTVTGASKRGWTTWLVGAVDPRATAIAPMVFDVLNITPHMERARATWGAPSAKIEPYTRRGLLEKLSTPEGRRLLEIVDPYSYRHTLPQPKLIINGTNDDYWVTGATSLYWDDLEGEKHLLYVPNNGHGLKDYRRVIGSVLALHEQQAGRRALPSFRWEFAESTEGVSLHVTAAPSPDAVRVWSVSSPTADLRKATWTSTTLSARAGAADHRLARSGAYQAFYIEAEFRRDRPLPLFLSTTLRVLPPAGSTTAAALTP